MKVIDYGLSFVNGSDPGNALRLWVESRCLLIDERDGTEAAYIQCAACKSENTFGEKDLFIEDNYDFIPIFGPRDELVLRRKAYLNVEYRTTYPANRLWGVKSHDYVSPPVAVELTTNAQIRAATHANVPMVGQTEIRNEDTGLRAVIEYPIKSMNIHDGRDIYQVDTGPVLFPDLADRDHKFVETVKLAYVAFNVSHFADFVCEVPTPIIEDGKKICRVFHYSQRHSVAAANRIYCLGELPGA